MWSGRWIPSCVLRPAVGPGGSTAMALTYRYPAASLVPDGVRAIVGLLITGAPLAALSVTPWFGMVLGAGVVLFGVFGVLTALRVRVRVRVDDEGIEVSPGRGRLGWSRVAGVKLRYFAVRRERERKRGEGGRRGWMQLVMRGDDQVVVRIDSRLDGFDDVLRRVTAAAARRGLDLDPVTRANFEAAGLTIASPPDEETAAGRNTESGFRDG